MMLSLICVITLNKAVVVEAAAKSNFNQRNLEHFWVERVQQLPKYTELPQHLVFYRHKLSLGPCCFYFQVMLRQIGVETVFV